MEARLNLGGDGAERFRNARNRREQGSSAEADASQWLSRHGYRVLARNVTNKAGEIDAIAMDGDTLCFVEVKARRGARFGEPVYAVDRRKQRRLVRLAQQYLVRRKLANHCAGLISSSWMSGRMVLGWRSFLMRSMPRVSSKPSVVGVSPVCGKPVGDSVPANRVHFGGGPC